MVAQKVNKSVVQISLIIGLSLTVLCGTLVALKSEKEQDSSQFWFFLGTVAGGFMGALTGQAIEQYMGDRRSGSQEIIYKQPKKTVRRQVWIDMPEEQLNDKYIKEGDNNGEY